ncbi:MAG TPA: hypothetical protein VMM35_09775 [Longimicrobiales bacterium]|nr:hypothetical protein [Longimicrobiales bacterium]
MCLMTALVLVVACGENGVEVDPAVAPFVGTWDATVYEIWPESDPSFVVYVLEEFGRFYITIEPSGQYTATLEHPQAQPQVGQLTVIGSTIRLDPTTPPDEPTATATFSFTSEDYLVLDGSVEIDFNDDGTRDPAGSHIELQRR